jgi:hypothetical protein
MFNNQIIKFLKLANQLSQASVHQFQPTSILERPKEKLWEAESWEKPQSFLSRYSYRHHNFTKHGAWLPYVTKFCLREMKEKSKGALDCCEPRAFWTCSVLQCILFLLMLQIFGIRRKPLLR